MRNVLKVLKKDRLEGVRKQKVQFFVLCVGILLLIGKFFAYRITNSVAILTDAVESIVNVVAALAGLLALIAAAVPRDKTHPFGHGKFELLSASLEGLMIVVAGGYIIFEGVWRLFFPSVIQKLDIGIAVVAVAGVVNLALGAFSVRMGRKYDSVALVSGGKHLYSDSFSTIGMIVGLFILYFTQLAWIDTIIALIFGAFILVTGIGILRKTIAQLTDEADPKVLKKILEIMKANRDPEWIDIHNLKITKYGSDYYLDCDLTLPMFYSISDGHASYRRLKKLLQKEFSATASFSIHFDSCEAGYCKNCRMKECPLRREEFVKLKPLNMSHITADIIHS